MFEIIMLLAFLWAATSQLLPRNHGGDWLKSRKATHGKKQQTLQRSTKRSGEPRVNAKSRNCNYAHAA